MRTKGQKRIAHWMGDFRRWNEKQMKTETGNFDTPESQYAYGVSLAIGVSTGVMKSWFGKDIDRDYDAETSRGYHDGIALLNKVVESGDAPEGDFQVLLDERSPLMGDTPEDVWNEGLHALSQALDALHDEEVLKQGRASEAEMETFAANAVKAMYCFEEVDSNGWETEFSPTFAKAARDLAEGFANGDNDRMMRGNHLAIATAESLAKKLP